ncbi:MAG: fibronectin type III domain-containing protein [Candidatus Thorarchaeota archaeon]|jgi:hypothetical protein
MKFVKVLIVCCLIFIGSVSLAFAEVRLTWDESPAIYNVDLYQVELDGQVVADVVPNTFTLVNISDGPHTARVRAHNVWGWSEFSDPLDFTKALPAVPQNIRLEF